MNPHNRQEEKVIRLSLSWVALGLIGITGLGILGGALGQQIISPPLPPLNGPSEKLVTAVQEVTLSPSITASKIVTDNQRSVLTIASANNADKPAMIATGLVVTNDGLIVIPGKFANQDIVAIDYEGTQLELTLVGTDTIFGLSYWRLKEGVFVPLEIRQQDAPVATKLLLMTRSGNTFLNKVESFRINEYTLPTENTPIGLQRVIRGNRLSEEALNGSPLVDDEGRISGILIDSTSGLALPATAFRESLDRITNREHEMNPIAVTGITPRYSFEIDDSNKRRFTVTVGAVAPNSSAALAGILAGDIITKVKGEEVSWSHSFMQSISSPLPLEISIVRQQEEQIITLNEPPES